MALNLKNPEVERLATAVAEKAGETKTEAIRKALKERQERLALTSDDRPRALEDVLEFLRQEVWPLIPPDQLGRGPNKAEREAILGLGSDGV